MCGEVGLSRVREVDAVSDLSGTVIQLCSLFFRVTDPRQNCNCVAAKYKAEWWLLGQSINLTHVHHMLFVLFITAMKLRFNG
jgi:hypothetical protein